MSLMDPRSLSAPESGIRHRSHQGVPLVRLLGTSKGGGMVLLDGADQPVQCRVLIPAGTESRCIVFQALGRASELYLMGAI